jgi:hypothetical protein
MHSCLSTFSNSFALLTPEKYLRSSVVTSGHGNFSHFCYFLLVHMYVTLQQYLFNLMFVKLFSSNRLTEIGRDWDFQTSIFQNIGILFIFLYSETYCIVE